MAVVVSEKDDYEDADIGRPFRAVVGTECSCGPIEEHKHYRNFVLNMCPNVTQFDSSPVTATERKRSEVWAQTYRRVLQKEDEEEYY